MWKNVWNTDGLPKINMLCWTLSHNKILTGGNLQKRGFKGLYKCVLCRQAEETSVHLFQDCPFSKKVWTLVFQNLFSHIRGPNAPNKIFSKCKSSYRGSLDHKQAFKVVFLALHKFTTWKIWLARNHVLFSEEFSTSAMVDSKSLGLMVEQFNMRKQKL
jgi:hypothetical protein